MFQTKIYIASTKALFDDGVFENLYKTVPEYRQKKIDSYGSKKEKCLSLGAGLLLSRAIKDAGLDESDMVYGFKESGMPYFKNYPEVCFSLSHSEERVMCGFSTGPVGVDTELITPEKAGELDEWCHLESYAKATDTPMAALMGGRFSFNTEFRFKEIDLNDGYKYVACSEEFLNDGQILVVELKN